MYIFINMYDVDVWYHLRLRLTVRMNEKGIIMNILWWNVVIIIFYSSAV